MKNIMIVLVAVCMYSVNTFAQKIATAKVPAMVVSAFQGKFPTATDVQWEKENATEYEANFKTGKTKQSAKYDKDGTWLETETDIEPAALPVAVSKAVAAQYAGYKLKEMEKVETHDAGLIYEVEMTKGAEKKEVRFDTDGKVLDTSGTGK